MVREHHDRAAPAARATEREERGAQQPGAGGAARDDVDEDRALAALRRVGLRRRGSRPAVARRAARCAARRPGCRFEESVVQVVGAGRAGGRAGGAVELQGDGAAGEPAAAAREGVVPVEREVLAPAPRRVEPRQVRGQLALPVPVVRHQEL